MYLFLFIPWLFVYLFEYFDFMHFYCIRGRPYVYYFLFLCILFCVLLFSLTRRGLIWQPHKPDFNLRCVSRVSLEAGDFNIEIPSTNLCVFILQKTTKIQKFFFCYYYYYYYCVIISILCYYYCVFICVYLFWGEAPPMYCTISHRHKTLWIKRAHCYHYIFELSYHFIIAFVVYFGYAQRPAPPLSMLNRLTVVRGLPQKGRPGHIYQGLRLQKPQNYHVPKQVIYQ